MMSFLFRDSSFDFAASERRGEVVREWGEAACTAGLLCYAGGDKTKQGGPIRGSSMEWQTLLL